MLHWKSFIAIGRQIVIRFNTTIVLSAKPDDKKGQDKRETEQKWGSNRPQSKKKSLREKNLQE